LLPFQDDVLLEIKQKHEQKQWENKFCFNIFFATKILFPLLGGKCLINGDHKHALKKKDVPLLLPHEFGWKGLGMGKKNFAFIE